MATDLIYGLLPEHLLLALILVLMLVEIFQGDKKLGGVIFTLFAAAGCVVLAMQLSQGYTVDLVPKEINIDRFALIARLVILGCGLILGICSLATSSSCKFWMLLASSLLGALIIMDSAGFISLFIGIEMLSLPAFAMMVTGDGASSSSEGAFKYLVLSSVATALILFGLSLVYGVTGSLSINAFVVTVTAGGPQSLAASIIILSGFFLKAAVFPFHGWAPDAYSSVRIHITAFLASVIKGAVVLALVRILSTLALSAEVVTAVTVLSLASIFYGNTTAIKQTSFKKLLAYSSIAHAGYMMFALIDSTGGRTEALLYYVSVYALTTIIACACFSLIVSGDKDDLSQLDGAFLTHPVASVLLALAVLSMAGIPPLPGFLAKFLIFKSVIASGHFIPAVLAFAGSYIGVIFYLGIVYRLFSTVSIPAEAGESSGSSLVWSGVVLGSAIFFIFMLLPGVFHTLLI